MVTDKTKKEQDTNPCATVPSNMVPPEYQNGFIASSVTNYQQPPAIMPSNEPPIPSKQEHLTVVIGRAKDHKSLMDAYILWFPLGLLGFHHFYLRRYEMGFLYFFTLGLCGIGWLVDAVRMPQLVKNANKKIDRPDEFQPLTICDAYVMWFPLGVIGLHHYYLRRPAWGLLYTFTGGLFGIGWLIDAFRIPSMVRDTNARLERERMDSSPKQVHLCDAYALGATPLGIFGAHHFYMGRHAFGLFYLFTLGGCGIGWITDWFRMKCLVDRVNNPLRYPLGKRHKYLDDAYVLAFPLGVLGTHHFYLERPVWGILYFFTLGLGGVGWLIDLIRMPCLVKETNKKLEEDLVMINEIRQQIGVSSCTINTRNISVNQSTTAATAPAAVGSSYPAASDSMSSYGSLEFTPVLAPPPYAAAMPGYSGYGHVYTVNAPTYYGPSSGPVPAPYDVGMPYMPVPSGHAAAPPGIFIVPVPQPGAGDLPTVHDNMGYKTDQA